MKLSDETAKIVNATLRASETYWKRYGSEPDSDELPNLRKELDERTEELKLTVGLIEQKLAAVNRP